MRYNWLEKNTSNNKLLIVTLGWGASSEVLGGQLMPQGYDVLCFFDYKTFDLEDDTLSLNNLLEEINAYQSIKLFSWSFGVWAAEQFLGSVSFDMAIAVAGTVYPINKDYGIDPRAFEVTLRGILQEGVVKFVARMCGRTLAVYMKNHSTRELEDIREELKVLFSEGQLLYNPKIQWSRAILCGEDKIYPVKPSENYWKTSTAEIVIIDEMPHYPFAQSDFLVNALQKDFSVEVSQKFSEN